MAKIETIGFNPKAVNDPEQQTEIINVSASVGANGVNNHEDVIVVQALLKYALERNPDFRNSDFPEPSGAFIKTTAQLIKKYQRHQSRNGQKVPIDGRIDPVRGGIFAYGSNKWWTIYALNVEAFEPALLYGDKSPIEGICKRWAFIKPILNKNGAGSLDLSLE